MKMYSINAKWQNEDGQSNTKCLRLYKDETRAYESMESLFVICDIIKEMTQDSPSYDLDEWRYNGTTIDDDRNRTIYHLSGCHESIDYWLEENEVVDVF